MAVKYFCDVCKKEVDKLYTIDYLCHIASYGDLSTGFYIDVKTKQRVSGRKDTQDVCLTCYNRAMSKMFGELTKIKQENSN